MTNREILQASIKKAISNGYKIYSDIDENSKLPTVITSDRLADAFTFHNLYFTHIFSHNFAKAFWGDKYIACPIYDTDGAIIEDMGLVAWQYHLQQMVLESEPLKYLEKFL